MAKAIELPSEILYTIADFIDLGPLFLPLRLVCRRWCATFTPLSVQSVGIIVAHPLKMVINEVAHHGSYGVPYEAVPDTFIHHIRSLSLAIFPRALTPEIFTAPFWEQLCHLSGVEKLVIHCYPIDEELERKECKLMVDDAVHYVIHAFDEGLKELTLLLPEIELKTLPDDLSRLWSLEVFKLIYVSDSQHNEIRNPPDERFGSASQLRSLVERNPSIRSIAFRIPGSLPINFHDIFPPHCASSSLQRLSFNCSFLPTSRDLYPISVPKNLQHLELKHSSYRPEPLIDIDLLWHGLKDSGVSLKTLTTVSISTALLEYLESFKGLQKCVISIGEHVYSGLTAVFIRKAIWNHACTMEQLHIIMHSGMKYLPHGCDGLIFTPENDWDGLLAFPKLRSIIMLTFESSSSRARDTYYDNFLTSSNLNKAEFRWFDPEDRLLSRPKYMGKYTWLFR